MASTSKKLYEQIAGRIRDLPIDDSERELIAATFASIFAKDNPRFDGDVFRAACRPDVDALRYVDPDALANLMIDYLAATFVDDSLPTLSSLVDVAREAALSRRTGAES